MGLNRIHVEGSQEQVLPLPPLILPSKPLLTRFARSRDMPPPPGTSPSTPPPLLSHPPKPFLARFTRLRDMLS